MQHAMCVVLAPVFRRRFLLAELRAHLAIGYVQPVSLTVELENPIGISAMNYIVNLYFPVKILTCKRRLLHRPATKPTGWPRPSLAGKSLDTNKLTRTRPTPVRQINCPAATFVPLTTAGEMSTDRGHTCFVRLPRPGLFIGAVSLRAPCPRILNRRQQREHRVVSASADSVSSCSKSGCFGCGRRSHQAPRSSALQIRLGYPQFPSHLFGRSPAHEGRSGQPNVVRTELPADRLPCPQLYPEPQADPAS